jgi:hypothetical protein
MGGTGFFGDLQSFLAQPFSPSMSAYRWFLFMGLLLVISVMWHMVIRALTNV